MKKINNYRSKQLSTTLNKVTKFLSENEGILKEIYRAPLYNDEPKIFNYSAKYVTMYKNNFEVSSGVSFDKKLALIRVLGETIERHSINKFKPKILVTGTKDKIENFGEYLDPLTISPFSQKQLKQESFKKFKISKKSKFNWTNAFSINKNKNIFLPCQLISFNYSQPIWEPTILPIISTGTAFALNHEDALYRGLCEIVERDAFIISYLNKLPSPKIDLESIKDEYLNNILQNLRRYKLEVIVLDLTTDIDIPVFASIIVDRTGFGPSISIGLKSGFEIKDVIIGAIEESLMTRGWIRDKFIYFNPDYKKTKEIKNIEQRAYIWFSKDMIKNLSFWLKGKKFVKININHKKNNSLKETIKVLGRNGMNVIYKDITPKEVKRSGFIVLRVIVPEMQALYLDERFKFLGNKRLYETPIKLNFTNRRKNESDFNDIPHPFL